MVMNRILFFTLSLVMAITAYGQNSASVDTLQTASDSTSVGSHAEFSAARQESNVSKAEGDSAIYGMIMFLPFKYMRIC